jgi:hypothetical protein
LVSPKEVKKENKKLVYKKPVLIGLGDTLDLGAGACTSGSYFGGKCAVGHSATGNCQNGFSALGSICGTGTWKV